MTDVRLKPKKHDIDAMYPRLMRGEKTQSKPSKTKPIWCPFCQEWTKFVRNCRGYRVTQCCGYSDSDFWIKTYNPQLWGWGGRKKRRKIVRWRELEKTRKK